LNNINQYIKQYHGKYISNKSFELSIIKELKLKTGVMMLKNAALHHRNKLYSHRKLLF